MTVSRKPRCFIAMAFDHEDTEALFENAILPILKANNVVPVIINRREDNRDINHQIIEQLNTCDFCITDLTYARPSVYFEAGYAQRSVEVIYTVRSDHLNKNQPDDRRVHFDLQMKPLIKWSNPDDKTFPEKLDRRLKKTVLRDWKRTQEIRERKEKQRDDFKHMPLNERLVTIRNSGLRILNKLWRSSWQLLHCGLGYKRFNVSQLGKKLSYQQMLRFRNPNSIDWFTSSIRSKRSLSVIAFRTVEESLTLKTLRDEFGYPFFQSHRNPFFDGEEMIKDGRPVTESIEHYVLCSVKAVPQAIIMSAIPSLRWDPNLQCYCANEVWKDEGIKHDERRKSWDHTTDEKISVSVSRSLFIHFIDGIVSIPEFETSMGIVAERIESNQP